MERLEQFYNALKNEMTALLATAGSGSVTMRTVSPVYYEGSALIFTDSSSVKYVQLKADPACCLYVGGFFAEAEAEFRGKTLLDGNKALRDAYSLKFPDAFDEKAAFGGRNAEFLLLRPVRITGWAFENDIPSEDGVPTIPFEISLR